MPLATSLAPRLAEYRVLFRKDRRRRYLGLAVVLVGIMWLGLAALAYFDVTSPIALPLGILLTILIPGMALLYEALRQPTSADTARTLDGLLDNRQRVLTSVELLGTTSEFSETTIRYENRLNFPLLRGCWQEWSQRFFTRPVCLRPNYL